MSTNIGGLDAAILAGYMLAVLALGIGLGRGPQSATRYFLGDRALPWGALLLSIVATETSTVTFLSLPGLAAAAGGNLTFLQITLGYIVGRMGVIHVLLPLYFRGKPFTAYEVLEARFGIASRRLASSLFLLTRNASDALRLFLTALVLQVVFDLDLNISVICIGVVTILYTFIGGARSVIWNDCVQFFIYMLGALAAAWIIVGAVPGGIEEITKFAHDGGKLRVLDFDMNLYKPSMTFWAGLAGGAFLTAATHGTDQMMVQRYLSARNRRDASLALGVSGFIVSLQFAVFLLIGVGLASLFDITEAGSSVDLRNDQLLAYFIAHYMPPGLLGITLAAVFAAAMSTLSSSLNSSAAAFVNDIYVPLRGRDAASTAMLKVGRIATVVFGLVQIGIALAFGLIASSESIIANVLKISGFAAGPVLGLYFLGVFAPRVRQRAALTGFVVGVGVLSVIAYSTPLHWAWYALVGSVLTFLAGNLMSLLEERKLEQ